MQACEHPDPSNRPEDYRSFRAITLGTNENEQGGYYFMILKLGKGFIGSTGLCYLLLNQ